MTADSKKSAQIIELKFKLLIINIHFFLAIWINSGFHAPINRLVLAFKIFNHHLNISS